LEANSKLQHSDCIAGVADVRQYIGFGVIIVHCIAGVATLYHFIEFFLSFY
jgi:protein tyrosine phosphatase